MDKDEIRIRHAIEAARKIAQHSAGETRASLDSDEKLLLSLAQLEALERNEWP